MEEGKETIIPMEQLYSYTRTLNELQARQLLATIKSHPQLEVVRKMGQEYVKGDLSFIRQLEYLLKLHAQRQPPAIFEQSSMIQSVIDLHFRDCASLKLSDTNFSDFIDEVKSLKVLSPLERVFTLDNRFSIGNRCSLTGKVILLFRQFHELVLLQAMTDGPWNLESLIPIKQTMTDKRLSAARSINEEGIKLLFLRAIEKDKVNWQKFEQHIDSFFKDSNKDENQCILTTSSLLKELRNNSRIFGKALKFIIHEDDLKLPADENIENITISQPTFPFNVLHDLALTLLKRNASEWAFKGELLDPITCFNIIAMEERNLNEYKIGLSDGVKTERFLLMVEENRLFKIVSLQQTGFQLQEAQSSQITDEQYLIEIGKMRVTAVLNRLNFITFPCFPKDFSYLSPELLTKVGSTCYSRLHYYDWKLSQLSYRVEITNKAQIEDWEQDYQMRFDTGDSIIDFLGKLSLQTQGFKRRFRIEKKPCLEGTRQFCSKLVKMKLAQ